MVLQGKGSWLFLKNDSNDVINQITGGYHINEHFLYSWRNLLSLRKAFFDKKGIKYHYLCVPNKECVKSKYLPDGLLLSENRPISRLSDILDKTLESQFSYPLTELSNSTHSTFPRGDSHWNQYGAYIAYSVMMKQMGFENIIHEKDVEFLTVQRTGDLISKLEPGATEEFLICKFNIPSSIEIEHDNRINNRGKLIIINNPLALNDSTLVLFRDSFGSALIHFLARTFSRVVSVWQPNIDWNIIEEERPQYVISQQAERFMIQVPDDISGETNNILSTSKNNNVEKYYKTL